MLSIEVLDDGGVLIVGGRDDLRVLAHDAMFASMTGRVTRNFELDGVDGGGEVEFVIERERP